MKQVILHVGMHKTGTTAIQESLAGYDDGTTCYAQFGGSNHSVPIATIFSQRHDRHHAWADRGATTADVQAMRARYVAALDQQLGNTGRDRLLISGEGIGSLRRAEKAALVAYLTARGLDVTIVCFTRDPASVVASIVQQRIKGGLRTLEKTRLKYRAVLEPFLELLPPEKVLVRDFQTEIDTHGDAVTAFAKLCGLDERGITPQRRNESLSLAATRLVLRLNRLPLNTFGSSTRFRARRAVIAALAKAFPNVPGAQIDRTIVNDLAAVAHADLAFLRDQFGIAYAGLPDVKRLDRVKAYLFDRDGLDYAGLRAIMDRLGLNHRDDDDPDGWLAGLFHHFTGHTMLGDADADRLRTLAGTIADGGAPAPADAIALIELAIRLRPDDRELRRTLKQLRQRK